MTAHLPRVAVRALLVVLSLASLLVVPVAPASAGTVLGGGAHNLVQVHASYADQVAARGRAQAVAFPGPVVGSVNLAAAVARDCTGCRSQAAALQAVVVTGDPEVVRPTNAAIALNAECSSCSAYAYAYQYVVGAPHPVTLSPSARQAVAELGAQAEELVAQPLAHDELDAALDALAARLKDAVLSDLAAQRVAGTAVEHRSRRTASP